MAAPVSFAQQGLWYQAELEPGNPAYNVPVSLSLRGTIDRSALVSALEAIVARHEILRTTFALDGAELIQVIHPAMVLPFREESVEGGEPLRASIAAEIHTPFDLVRGPLLRAVLYRLAPGESVLLLTMHHLVTDGWSLGVMVKELAAFYRRFAGDGAAPLPELEIQFADYAEWQREQAEHAWGAQLEYWKERLRAPLGRQDLPTDFAPATQTFDGATETFRIGAATVEKLRELSRQSGSTLFITLLAAFKVLLYRHTNVADVVVGSPVANRNSAATENLVGFFVNTQVLRTSLEGNPTFIEALERVRETTLGAWENQDVPLELLTSVLQPERKREPSPFFQVMFALQNAPIGTLELPGVTVERMDVVTDTAKMPLTVINEEVGDELEVRMEYRTALFTPETIQRIGRRYERLLQAVCADPQSTIEQLPLLPDSEHALLREWGGASARFETPRPLHRWFEEQAALTPDRIALRCDRQELTYRELDEQANRLARHLRTLGVAPETLVGLCLERSLELIVGILAILKAGGAYVPLDPSYPENRLRFVIEDSAVPVVITHSSHQHVVRSAPRVVLLDREADAIAAHCGDHLAEGGDASQAAYVIYTSGSTGQPKGVVVTHANVARLMSSTERLFGFGQNDVWTLFHSYAFDFSVWEIWGALLYGGRLVVVPYATSRAPEIFHRLLVDEGVTVLNQTPSAFYQLMGFDPPPSLRTVIFGGEALDFERLRGWFERNGDERPQLINMYGITETTVHVTHRRVRPADLDLDRGRRSMIGRPLPDLEAHVLDARGEPVPIGVAGELYVGGAGVARGYLRRPELTAARFLERPAGRLYRSGDSVRWLPSGELEYLGRIDTQVKIRGFRIELGEIEHLLRAAEGVRDAVVVARPGPSAQPRLIAWCIAAAGVTPNALRKVCEEQLPEYMVPSAYVLVDSFPLNANGKLDRDALPDPDLDHDVAHEEYVAPTNETEAKLARIWCEVLHLEQVGITDNFFALGGDSILLLQVAAKSAKAGVKLTRRNLVELQTIQELAAVAVTAPIRKAATPPPETKPAPAATIDEPQWEAVYPLTPLQQGLLFHSVDAPRQDFYIEQLHVELHGAVDLDAFERAWREVIARHDVLRTSFVWSGTERPHQRVSRSVPFALHVEDWRELDPERQAARLQSRLDEDRARGFDLSVAPLTRVAMFRLADDRWHWLWTHHHLILDGWSLSAVIGEVLRCYRAFCDGVEPLLEQRRPFRDFIDWLEQQDGQAAEAFWRETLAGLAEPTRIDALQRVESTSSNALQRVDGAVEPGGELEIRLSSDETGRLQEWARHHQLTLSTIVTAAWARLLQTWSGSDDVVFGVTVAGRPAELTGYEQMVGPFINTLPLRVRVAAELPLDRWLRDLQMQHGRMREYESSRLVDIQRWSPLRAGQSLFETMVVFENYPVDQSLREQESRLSFGPVTFVERGHYGLALAAIPGPELALRLYYDGARFDSATMRRVLAQLRTLLDAAASGETASVAQWSLLTTAERAAAIAPETVSLDPRSPHELFEEQAAHAPGRVALVLDGRELTYGELDARANRLANRLQRRGVGADVLVGIRMPRSFEQIVAVLAVWKAGGAYLPLDPAYPERRLAWMAENAGAAMILTAADFDELESESDARPASDASGGNLAWVIYTSGSTGLPKGTLVERRGVTNLAHALASAFSIDPDSRVLQFASLSFDVSASEIVMALCFGASLHLAHADELLPGPDLARVLRERRITHLSIVPSALAAVPFDPLPDLRCLIVGGEPCPPDLLQRWSAGRQLFNCYGPTETTVCATYSLCDGGRLTIGRPIANVRTHVLDAHGAPLPAGAPGELHIGGAGVARGYAGRPELSSERFVRDPFSSDPEARLYRTGDLVRELPDGNLEFLGRIDDQVKVRGFRIEPGEIAQVLRDRGGLRAAAVIMREGRLVAYCVAGGEVTPRDLRDACAEWLPEHMVPSAYVFVAGLPLTASGKLDRDALPDPDLDHDIVRDHYVAPNGEVETVLARVWSEVLGVARVGAADNFFELGGDSILSLQVVSRARQAGLHVTPRQLFQHPTIAQLAREARQAEAVVARGETLTAHPLTPIQRWFFEQELLHRDRWNQAVLVEVASSIDDRVLEDSIQALAAHHDAFRSRFEGSRQRYAAKGLIAFERVPLPADLERLANGAQAGLDLERGPLALAIHFRGEGRSLLLLVAHHLIVDGVSWRVLLDDLSRLCRGEQLEPALSFGEWAQRLDASAKSNSVDVGYWLALEPSSHQPLPVDKSNERGANRAGSIDIVELRLDEPETDALLRQVPAAYRTQVNDVLLAAFAAAMRHWSGHDSLWVNLEGHGRETLFDDADLSRTVGWFTSLFPVHLQATSDEPGTLLRSVREQLRAIPDHGVGFGLARYLQNDARLASLPSPDVSFNYLGQFDQAEAETGVFRLLDGPVGEGQHPDEHRLHLLDVVASVQSRQFRVAWHYSRHVHERTTVERLAASFVATLRRLIEHCVRLAGSGIEIEDVYPLTPMQQGLLFHALQSNDSGLYVEQLQGELHGALDAAAFERAWQEVIRRHEVFRTSFAWDGLEEPLQRVQREVAFRVDLHDWRGAADQGERVARYLDEDRLRGLALDAAPVFRVALLRLDDERWKFVWTHHHILLDGWCMNLVVREVLECYEAFTGNGEPPQRRSRPYRDYLDWLAKQDVEAARRFWTRTLGGFTTATRLQLPEKAAAHHGDTESSESGQAELALTALETRRLQSWARRNHVTLNTLVTGAWARLLQSISGSTDVTFGVTVSGRPSSLAGSEEMIGLFINTLPLRVGHANGIPLNEWLQNVQARQTELRDYEYSRLVDVQRWSDLPAGEPLFDTLLAFDNYPADRALEQRFGQLEIHDARLAERTHYALALSVAPSDELRMRALYDGQRFTDVTIRRLLESMKSLLLAAASGEVRTAGDWRMVTHEEKQQLLDLAGAEAPPVTNECLGDWFSRVAATHGHAIALTFEGERLTYEELERRANQLAHHLQSLGVGPETLVGLCVDRSAELIVGMLAIVKAGGAYVPLDPSYPADRLRFIAADSGLRLVVTHSASEEAAGALLAGDPSLRLVSLSADAAAISIQRADAPIAGLQPENAAYIIYTSGSTGRPKGCVVTHANVSRLMRHTESSYAFSESDVWTLFHSAAFDFSVWEIWGALLYGGRLVVVPYATSRSPEQFYDLLQRERVTVLNQTPSAFRQLMAVDEARRADLDLRYVIFGGEALQLESLRGWLERHGDERPLLVNMYGITETTVHVTFRPIRLADLGRGSVIGTPIADLRLYLLDPYGQLVPEGMIGELYVAGAGLSRGYLGHPALTAERMVPNPFGPGRLYRTGDLARRIGADLEYLGRADDQVKVRGFRIETGEIEAVLARHPAVRETVVMLKAYGGEEKRLVAYVVRRGDATIEELRDFLGAHLPDYMIPAAFVFLEAMPLTSNGKINRAALPLPTAASGSDDTAPRTEAERVLAEIWGEVLGVERVGIHDNFFALGGDSIRSIQILSRARARGFDCSFQELFARPTIAELVEGATSVVQEAAGGAFSLVGESVRALLPPDVEDAYPLSRLQQGMFFHSGFEPEATAYHDVMSYHLRAPYDGARLGSALAAMAVRHPILRTRFDFTSFGEPLQLVQRSATIPLDETDLRAVEEQDAAIHAWVEQERRSGFASSDAPLLRVHVHRRTDETFQLSLSFHHAILDGWSVATLLSELFRAYLARPLAEAPRASFREFIALERRAAESEEERLFWRDFLADAPAGTLPRLRDGSARHAVRQQPIDIGESTSHALRELAGQAGVPIRSLLLAAHVRALSHIMGSRDVVTGLVTNARPEEEGGDRVLGLFLNTLPFRMRLGGGTWLDLVQQTFAVEQQVNSHRRHPLAEIQKAIGGGTPLFETDFNFVHFHVLDEVTALGGVESLGAEGFEETNFALAVNFSWWGNPGRLAAALDYDASLLTGEQAAEYARVYADVLEAVATRPHERHDAQALTPAPAQPVSSAVPESALHELIAPPSPATAVTCEGESLSYDELHRRANRLANALRRKGVGPDVLVGVALQPGLDRLVALLGVLKAGGAYLPLDPDSPAQRLSWMIEDSAIEHIVTRPGVLPASLRNVQTIDVDCPGEEESAPRVSVAPDNLAYALYTSGSTGTPKGVLLTHRGIVNHMLWMQRAYPLTPEDVVFQKTPFTFDASVWEFWAPLMAGASLHVAKSGGLQDPAYLIESIRQQRITILQVVPTLLEALLAEPAFGETCHPEPPESRGRGTKDHEACHPEPPKSRGSGTKDGKGSPDSGDDRTKSGDPSLRFASLGMTLDSKDEPSSCSDHAHAYALAACRSLRRVFVGGEPLSRELVRRFGETLPDAELVNLYGPTETTIDATSHRFAPVSTATPAEAAGATQRPPIGRPVENVRAHVLDEALHFVPVGTEGDLYLAGEALGRGYLNRAALTAASFVANPYGPPGSRMYRTGDRARWLPEGSLEFIGRADQQIKIRGHRVELGEVEAALASREGVEHAVAGVVDGRLVAWLVAHSGIDSAELREHLRERLPAWMVPSFFVAIDSLPLTSSGKVDRKALPKPEASDAAAHAEFVEASTAAERAVAAAWESILGVGRIGVHDNFFELGGDSILSLRIASRLREEGWKVSPRLILQQQTVARVAAHAERAAAPSRRENVEAGAVPLSPIQRAFFGQPLPNPSHWNQSVMLSVPHDFSADAFRTALAAVARHHDAFRLRFVPIDGGWRQEYAHAPGAIPLDLERDIEKTQASLDITNGPLMRAALFDGQLLLVAHHLIVDGVSWRILFEDLATAYGQALRNEPLRLPEPTASLRTWMASLQARATTADPAHWLALESINPQPLPAEPCENREADAQSLVTHLGEQETRVVTHDLPRRMHARVTEILLTALSGTITAWTGGDTLWVDVEGHGREDLLDGVDVSRTVGWFTSVFPLALSGPERGTPAASLESVKAAWRAVPDHGIDFGVLRHLSPDPSLRARLAALPAREISFNYLGRFDAPADGPFRPSAEAAGDDHDRNAPRSHLLDLNARVVGGCLTIEWTYAGQAFDRRTIESLSAHFLAGLRELAASERAGYVPSDFPLARLDPDGLEALVGGSRGIEDILPLSPLQEGLLFHAMDEEQQGVYVQQITAALDGDPDPIAFEKAWDRTIARYPVLRTSFHRRDLQRPLQVVHEQARGSVTWIDWRTLSSTSQEAAWQALLREDRAAGIDLERPPLMRVTVVRETQTRSRLLWTHHHLILDGWSLPLVLRDLVAFYREESEGVPAQAVAAPPYASFIEWLEARDHGEAEAFWRETLRGFERPNAIALPTPFAPAATPFGDVELRLSEAFTARLAAVAQSSRVTLNTVVQAMWALLVARYSGRDDVVFGVTVSGRPADLPGIEQTAGLFINTLPLRVAIRPEQALAELLQDVQRRQSAMSQFEFTPLVEAHRCSAVPAGQELFESIFVFENYPLGESLDESPLADFTVRDAQSVEWTHYPLTCLVTPARELRLKLVFDTARFERSAMRRMLEEAEGILERFVAAPGETATNQRALPAAPARHPSRIDEAFHQHFTRFFHERFAEQARLTPDSCAIAFEEQKLSYGELEERANRLAHHLRNCGLGAEQVAGVFMDRSPDMIVALLAIMKAGGAYLPLDPRFPAERLAMMIAGSNPLLLLTQRHLLERMPHHDARVIAIDAEEPDGGPAELPPAALAPDNLAYVIFTSGSTGRPKGVQISHRALANLLESFERCPGLTSDDVLLAVTTLSFDIAALELFLPLTCGARLVIASADDAADGDRLAALLQRHQPTVMQATPATWRLLLLGGWTPPPSLRIWCGGEAMPLDLADELRANGSELWNVYGPTETTIWSAIHPVSGARDARALTLPVANTTLTVVDRHLNPVPLGIPGELLIGGDGLARGYRDQPALTAERFVPDPFTPGARAYRSGDQVRLREDGTIEFLGRDDTQVKIRGFRVELGEIEGAAHGVAGVRDAVVVFREGRLVGYVVRDTRTDLAAALRRTLPDYMVPALWIDLAALPLTPNGKVDRKALPLPGAAAEPAAIVRPRTSLEEVLAEVWKETLGLEQVGIHDNFFALGGHSLHAAQIVAWLRRVFQTKIPLRILFEASTIESLAAVLSQQQANAGRTADALLKIRKMSPEERALRLQKRQAAKEDLLR